jgi:signal transduction histidine kinase
MTTLLTRLYPSSYGLAARIGLVLLLAVAISVGTSATFIYIIEQNRDNLAADDMGPLVEKIVAAYRDIDDAAVGRRSAAAAQAGSPSLHLEWPALAPQRIDDRGAGLLKALQDRIQADLHDSSRTVVVNLATPRGFGDGPPPGPPPESGGQGPAPPGGQPAGGLGQMFPQGGFGPGPPPLQVSMRLGDGSWLAIQVTNSAKSRIRLYDFLSRVIPIALICVLLFIGLVLGFTRPLVRLGAAAERLGIEDDVSLLQETGAPEMRLAARAFNRMQLRLKRLIDDRTQMLAAISHDLKTPLTRLRLRAEFIEDAGLQEKMLADLAEMEAIVASTLAFARSDARGEPRETIDLADLLQSLAEARSDCGSAVDYEGPAHLTAPARPVALRRALGNLIDNAIKYGQVAHLKLRREGDRAVIEVEDEGPGIPPDQQELVFRPYFRLEGSRSRETGGVGLGLTIARAVIRAEGGDVALANRPLRGLRATVTLPLGLAAAGSQIC